MIKLHTEEAKHEYRALKPQLADTIARFRAVLLTEVTSLVTEKVPMKVFDKLAVRKVSELLLQRYDDATEPLMKMDQ